VNGTGARVHFALQIYALKLKHHIITDISLLKLFTQSEMHQMMTVNFYSHTLIALLFDSLKASTFLLHHSCSAKEIVPTKKWQRVMENDTLPVGMHIKVDLQTGKKWANIADDLMEDYSVEVKENGEVNGPN
jgi:hypothetical protein